MRSREHLLSPGEYRLITSDIVVFGSSMLGIIALALRWTEPDQRSFLWLLLAGTATALVIGLSLWVGNRNRLAHRETSPPTWWLVGAVSLISIGPALYLAGTLAWQEVTSPFATFVAVAYWLLVRTLALRLLEPRDRTANVMV